MTEQSQAFVTTAGIPHLEHLVSGSRDNPASIWTVGTFIYPTRYSSCIHHHRKVFISIGRIPDFECVVIGSRDNPASIWTVGTPKYRCCMTEQSQALVATAGIPDLERLVSG